MTGHHQACSPAVLSDKPDQAAHMRHRISVLPLSRLSSQANVPCRFPQAIRVLCLWLAGDVQADLLLRSARYSSTYPVHTLPQSLRASALLALQTVDECRHLADIFDQSYSSQRGFACALLRLT